jgi:hypothetical protein
MGPCEVDSHLVADLTDLSHDPGADILGNPEEMTAFATLRSSMLARPVLGPQVTHDTANLNRAKRISANLRLNQHSHR